MSDAGSQQPVFKKCARCGYSLRGLPANHACPECGLKYDERCELYRVVNPKQVFIIWIAIFGGGWMNLKNIQYLVSFGTASNWQRVLSLLALVWIIIVPIGFWFLVRHYRRGFEVAVTSDGLIVRLPGYSRDLIPWANIGGASVKELSEGKPQIVSVLLKDKQKSLDIGGVTNVFPTRADADRFVDQVNQRISE